MKKILKNKPSLINLNSLVLDENVIEEFEAKISNTVHSFQKFFESIYQKKKYNEKIILHFGGAKLSGMLGYLITLACLEKINFPFSSIYSSQIGSIFATMYNYNIPYTKCFSYIMEESPISSILGFKLTNIIKNLFQEKILKNNHHIHYKNSKAFIKKFFQDTTIPKNSNYFTFAEEFHSNTIYPFHVSQEISIEDSIIAPNSVLGIYPYFIANGKKYVDSGRLGNLPLQAIYENETQNNESNTENYTIIAFHEDFYIENKPLNIQKRLYYSFYEKIRNYHTINNIKYIKKKSIDLFLFSYKAISLENSNIFKLSRTEKYFYLDSINNNLNNQIMSYNKEFENKNPC